MTNALSVFGLLFLFGLAAIAVGLVTWIVEAIVDRTRRPVGPSILLGGLGLSLFCLVAGVITVGVAEDQTCRERGGTVVNEGYGTNCRDSQGNLVNDQVRV